MPFALTPLQLYGLWAMGGTLLVLLIFLSLRGRVPIDNGWGGMMIRRFGAFERVCHWLLALSFIVLAATGLTQVYGALLLPLLGVDVMAGLLALGTPLHYSAGILFMLTLVASFVLWVRHSIPAPRDVVWVAKAGGMLIKHSTPAAWKFNAGQKMLFWLVVLGGIGLSVTGFALLFPYRTGLASKIFSILAGLGFRLPVEATNLTPTAEVYYARLWHTALALGMVCIVMVHIYMRTIGIRGAFSAMTTGEVDLNVARQQNSLWAEHELKRMEEETFGAAPRATPAE